MSVVESVFLPLRDDQTLREYRQRRLVVVHGALNTGLPVNVLITLVQEYAVGHMTGFEPTCVYDKVHSDEDSETTGHALLTYHWDHNIVFSDNNYSVAAEAIIPQGFSCFAKGCVSPGISRLYELTVGSKLDEWWFGVSTTNDMRRMFPEAIETRLPDCFALYGGSSGERRPGPGDPICLERRAYYGSFHVPNVATFQKADLVNGYAFHDLVLAGHTGDLQWHPRGSVSLLKRVVPPLKSGDVVHLLVNVGVPPPSHLNVASKRWSTLTFAVNGNLLFAGPLYIPVSCPLYVYTTLDTPTDHCSLSGLEL